jgi:hypothetical protein
VIVYEFEYSKRNTMIGIVPLLLDGLLGLEFHAKPFGHPPALEFQAPTPSNYQLPKVPPGLYTAPTSLAGGTMIVALLFQHGGGMEKVIIGGVVAIIVAVLGYMGTRNKTK